MCGIIGKITREAGQLSPLTALDLDRLHHRGPDDRGIYNDIHASLGHLRLSIIDLSPGGHQPMHSSDDRYIITYNGEVYNYLEIKNDLIHFGYSFHTSSDTEVVLTAYIHWGPACLQHFRGMFALAIWDKQAQTLFMARDRCGEKPLIYYFDHQNFYFSSEFKGLVPLLPHMPRLNPSVVDMYLHYQYPPEPHTLLEHVHKLPAAHYAVLDVTSWSFKITKYWDLSAIQADPSITKQDIRDELNRAIRLSLRSDVPIGIALSAGIDSAGIAAIAAQQTDEPIKTFCVGYPGRPGYDERAEAQSIATFLKCHFHEVELTTEDFVSRFPGFALLLDEPVADIAAYGHYAVPKSCADQGIKVLLTGIGGDEVFWGYDWTRMAVAANQNKYLQILAKILRPITNIHWFYKFIFRLSRTQRIPASYRAFLRQILACIDQSAPRDQLIFMAASGAPEFSRYNPIQRKWYGPAMQNIPADNAYLPTHLKNTVSKNDVPIAVMDLLLQTWLTSNCLSLGDRVSMAVGVETRLPFLDFKLIETVVAWRKNNPDHLNGQKAMLREILADVLPEKTIRRRKSGFVPPVTKWISGIVQKYGVNLHHGHLVTQGILSSDTQTVVRDALPQTVYRLILLEQWYDGLTSLYHQNAAERSFT